MVQTILDSCGRIDILVNNAGSWPTENMIEGGIRGVIVNISSKSADQYNASGHGHYASAKAGLNMLTRVFARELSPRDIRIVGMAPGMVRTPMNEEK